jgi:hydroxymethylglutaryl-CoA reductase
MMEAVKGFSKLTKSEKIDVLNSLYFKNIEQSDFKAKLESFWHKSPKVQEIFDQFSENTISNFVFPYGVVPNFLLNNKSHTIPMVIEESSVVAACSKAAKFWSDRGGFHAEILGTEKIGQVHFTYEGDKPSLFEFFRQHKTHFVTSTETLCSNMKKRGGGLKSLELVDKTDLIPNYYQLYATFDTCDAMGANFINSVLEELAKVLKNKVAEVLGLPLNVIMSILSNYTPNCLVRASVRAKVIDLAQADIGMSGLEFCQKFILACKVAKVDVNRAVTHNKGIFNGIDAVVLATGNDFRATEACAHAYAAREGQYRGLSEARISGDEFIFSLEVPLSLGTIGGLTSLHPLAKISLEMLGSPSAQELMMIAAATGLAQNFAALRSLVTTGIQKGHMKMHLMNILNHFEATKDEREQASLHFQNEVISFVAVREFISKIRNYQ